MRLGEIPAIPGTEGVLLEGGGRELSRSEEYRAEVVFRLGGGGSAATIVGGESRFEQKAVLAMCCADSSLDEVDLDFVWRNFARRVSGEVAETRVSVASRVGLDGGEEPVLAWYGAMKGKRVLHWTGKPGDSVVLWDVEDKVEEEIGNGVFGEGDWGGVGVDLAKMVRSISTGRVLADKCVSGVEVGEVSTIIRSVEEVLFRAGKSIELTFRQTRVFVGLLYGFGCVVPSEEHATQAWGWENGCLPVDYKVNLSKTVSDVGRRLWEGGSGLEVFNGYGVGYGLRLVERDEGEGY